MAVMLGVILVRRSSNGGHNRRGSISLLVYLLWTRWNCTWKATHAYCFLLTTVGSYLENILFRPLSPIRRNYPKIIINNSPEFYYGKLKKALVTKPCCSIHQLWYSIEHGTFIECCSVRMCRYKNSDMILCICKYHTIYHKRCAEHTPCS